MNTVCSMKSSPGAGGMRRRADWISPARSTTAARTIFLWMPWTTWARISCPFGISPCHWQAWRRRTARMAGPTSAPCGSNGKARPLTESTYWARGSRSFSDSLDVSKPRWKVALSHSTWTLRWVCRSNLPPFAAIHDWPRAEGSNSTLAGFGHVGAFGLSGKRCSGGHAHLQAPVIAGLAPVDLRQHQGSVDTIAIADRDIHEGIEQGIR